MLPCRLEVVMATVKVSVPMQEQILELHRKEYSERRIARTLKIGRNTVRAVIKRGAIVAPGPTTPDWARTIDWERVRLEVSRGVQLNILAKELAGDKISYTQFWRQFYKIYPDVPQATMRLEHKPGERTYFDYTEGIDIVDRMTGEIRQTSLCCGVLAMSSYTYGEFSFTQKRDDLIRSMENAFRYFGGVTPYVTVDNQKAAVKKAHWYDPEVNPAFVDFANHWGFAVIPARPYQPQDKAANESGIGVIQRQFYQEVRHKTFYSLDELNREFWAYLDRLNTAKMKDWGVSRHDRFDGERSLLTPCPAQNWELAEWKNAKVHADCHVQVLKKFYSVPFKFVGRDVRVKVTSKLIEMFDRDLNPLAAHVRLHGKEIYSTDPKHYPEEKVAQVGFTVQHALKNADRVGPETLKLVKHLLNGPYPLKYLRRVQGILRLVQSGRVSVAGMEHAARLGMTYSKLQFAYIQATAEYFDKNGNRPGIVRSAPVREAGSMYLHNSFEREDISDQ